MKSQLRILALAMGITLVACTGNYKIDVKFANHDFDGKKAYLTNYDTGDTIDSVAVLEKHVCFEGDVDTAFFARLRIEDNRLDMIVEPGEIAVEWGKEIKVSGTPLNDKFNNLVKQLDRFDREWEQIAKAWQDGSLSTEQAQQRDDNRKARLLTTLYNGFLANKDNALGQWAFIQYLVEGEFTSSQLDMLLKKVPDQYLGLERVKQAKANAEAQGLTAVGQPFIDFEVRGSDGNVERLSHYAGDGISFTLVDFWASWCDPCMREIEGTLPHLYEKYNDSGLLKIVGVNVWDEPSAAIATVQRLSIPWHVMVGDHRLDLPTKLYGIQAIPYIVVIDPKGTIVLRGLNGDALIDAVEGLMAAHYVAK